MNIDKLAKIKNLNTKQQAEITKYNIAKTDQFFRDKEVFPEAIHSWLKLKQLSKGNCILVAFGQDPICCEHVFSGILLSENLHFWEFEVELDQRDSNVIEVYVWEDITKKISINEHAKGVGQSWGFLCIQVLRERLHQG